MSNPTPSAGLKLVCYPVDITRCHVIVPYLGNWTLGTYRKGFGWHTGLDYIGNDAGRGLGLPVRSIADGVVLESSPILSPQGYGQMVYIWHPELGVYSRSGHLGSRTVKTGDKVVMGQQIGTIGTSGTDNVHLHFDISKAELQPHRQWSGLDTQAAKVLVQTRFADTNAFFLAHGARNFA